MADNAQPLRPSQSQRQPSQKERWERRLDGMLVPPSSLAQATGSRSTFVKRETTLLVRGGLLHRAKLFGDGVRPLTSGDCLYGGAPSQYPDPGRRPTFRAGTLKSVLQASSEEDETESRVTMSPEKVRRKAQQSFRIMTLRILFLVATANSMKKEKHWERPLKSDMKEEATHLPVAKSSGKP